MVITAFKGFIIGSTMMVPGVSGGSMAMMLSVYNQLVDAVCDFFHEPVKNFSFLFTFALSAFIGMVLCARPILHLIEAYPIPSMCFFIGLVLGSVPMIVKESEVHRLRLSHLFWLALGLLVVYSLTFLPPLTATTLSSSNHAMLLQLVVGAVVAVGFLLPGISFSYLLLLLGAYDFILHALSSFNLLSLLPFGFGFVIGALLLLKVLQYLLREQKEASYFVILGFLLGSLVPVFPGFPEGISETLLTLVLFLTAFGGMYFLSKRGRR